MDSLHDDRPLLLDDDGNQPLNNAREPSASHEFVQDQTVLLQEFADPVEFYSSRANGAEDCSISAPIVAINASPMRKVRSAAPSSNGFDDADQFEDNPRPHTVAGADTLPSSSSPLTRNPKKKHPIARKKAVNSKTPREDHPCSTDVDGWGDFDTDRLLKDDPPSPEQEKGKVRSNQISLDPLDEYRSRSRKSRRSTPLTTSPSPNPWEGYLTTFQNESKASTRTGLQVLRQKPMEILSLDFVSPTNQPQVKAVATPKPLPGRVTLERLKTSQSRPPTGYLTQPATSAPLFGMEVPETPENRAVIFERLAPVWSLISDRPLSSSTERPSVNMLPSSVGIAHSRSPFECSMTMVKICKAVGISLTPSSATQQSFWYANEQRVNFEAFCDLVIQGAVQPALHHFRMDQSVSEYVSALDTIVQSLFTTTPARSSKDNPPSQHGSQRLRELSEIEPIFSNWKTGITFQLAKTSENSCPESTRAPATAEYVRKAVEASTSQRLLANQLPLEEARVTHIENIRRKVQLHKSWKFIVDSKITERGVLHSSQNIQMIQGSSTPSGQEQNKASDRQSMRERSQSMVSLKAADTRHNETHPFPSERDYTGLSLAQTQTADTTSAVPVTPEVHVSCDVTTESEQVLVCCSCSVRGAELWCSACFTVSCQKCWQDSHSCTVDMSLVAPTTKPALVGPSSLAMKKKQPGSTTLSPPVAMIYLPTKAMVTGKLAKGNPVTRNRNTGRTSSNQLSASTPKVSQPIAGVVAQAILPSLHESQSESVILQHHKHPQVDSATPRTESGANLVKALMLRTSPSTSTLEFRSSGLPSSTDSVSRMHNKYHRQDLHLASVSLDAALLLSHGPARKR